MPDPAAGWEIVGVDATDETVALPVAAVTTTTADNATETAALMTSRPGCHKRRGMAYLPRCATSTFACAIQPA